jgi:hypothetical protein
MSEQGYHDENLMKTPEADRIKLLDELKKIYNPEFSTLGHGAIKFNDSILKKGLSTAQPDLLSTALPLFDNKKPFEEQADELLNLLTHWPHLDAKNIVIVMIPNPDEDSPVKGRGYFNAVLEELPDNEKGHTPIIFCLQGISGGLLILKI